MSNSQQFNYGVSKIAQDIKKNGTSNFVTMAASYLENKKVNTPSKHVEGSEGSRIQNLSENTVYGGFPTIKK
jgi:hypothetical protein